MQNQEVKLSKTGKLKRSTKLN